MQSTATTINGQPSITILTLLPDGGHASETFTKVPALPHLQKSVEGFIETVPGFDTIEIAGKRVPCVAFCNEEGKLTNKDANPEATRLWSKAIGRPVGDVLVGNVIVIYGHADLMAQI